MSRRIQILFWLSFLYMTVALVFWGSSLYRQSIENINLRKEILHLKYPNESAAEYKSEYQKLDEQVSVKKKQYLGEGLTFFAFIIISGIIVYFSLRRESQRNAFQQNILLSITHELKTPLASAKLAMQTLERRELDRDQQKKVLALALEDINRLDEMINNILSINNLESNQIQINKIETSAHEILLPLVENYSKSQNTHKINLEGDDFELYTDPYLLNILLSNLISNAIKYSPGKDEIYIKTLQNDDKKIIEIIDLGDGIKKNEQDKVFRKFYRSGNEITRTSKGSGLGLYIVSKISKLLDIDLSYANTDGASVFKISLEKS